VPRPGDGLGGRRPGNHRVCHLCQPDGPLREEVDQSAGEPLCSRRSARPVDRQGAPAAAARTIVLDMDSSEARPTASRKAAPTTAVSAAPAVLTGSVHTSCGSTHMSMLSLTKSKPRFLLGLFLLCVCTLVRQIIETRIFSESHGIMSYFLRSASRCSE
jgi:hypothetical protein